VIRIRSQAQEWRTEPRRADCDGMQGEVGVRLTEWCALGVCRREGRGNGAAWKQPPTYSRTYEDLSDGTSVKMVVSII
jgi:hypothetical protein